MSGALGAGLIGLLRGGRSPLRLPIGLLCIDLFTWNAATLAGDLTRSTAWKFLDRSASPLTTPLVLEFVLAFVGQRRRFLWLRAASFARELSEAT